MTTTGDKAPTSPSRRGWSGRGTHLRELLSLRRLGGGRSSTCHRIGSLDPSRAESRVRTGQTCRIIGSCDVATARRRLAPSDHSRSVPSLSPPAITGWSHFRGRLPPLHVLIRIDRYNPSACEKSDEPGNPSPVGPDFVVFENLALICSARSSVGNAGPNHSARTSLQVKSMAPAPDRVVDAAEFWLVVAGPLVAIPDRHRSDRSASRPPGFQDPATGTAATGRPRSFDAGTDPRGVRHPGGVQPGPADRGAAAAAADAGERDPARPEARRALTSSGFPGTGPGTMSGTATSGSAGSGATFRPVASGFPVTGARSTGASGGPRASGRP